MSRTSLLHAILFAAPLSGLAAPAHYTLDPDHTYPSFEADHFGISYWRGKFDRSRGSVTLDKTAGTGTVEVMVDLSSIDFGMSKLDAWAKGTEFFDVAKFPTATYRGTLTDFKAGAPTHVTGSLTLHGVTRPVDLTLDRFKCIPDPDPRYKRERCGADALATFRRDAFGLASGKDYGFDMKVTLRIQVEAVKTE